MGFRDEVVAEVKKGARIRSSRDMDDGRPMFYGITGRRSGFVYFYMMAFDGHPVTGGKTQKMDLDEFVEKFIDNLL